MVCRSARSIRTCPPPLTLATVRANLRKLARDAGDLSGSLRWRRDALARIRTGYLGMRAGRGSGVCCTTPRTSAATPIPEARPSPVLAGLRDAMEAGAGDIAIISPHFVPGDGGN